MLDKAIESATNLLSRREHSRLELSRKLHRRGFDDMVIEQVLARMEHDRLLDESRFVEAYIYSRRNKGYGPVRIRMELRERGIEDSLISDFLNTEEPEWLDKGQQVRCKKFGTDLPDTPQERAKQSRFLQYRGFSSEHVRRVLNDDIFDEIS